MVWRNAPADGNPSAINHLLNLAAEIPVPKVKHLLQAMISLKGIEHIPESLRTPVLRVIATLSRGGGDDSEENDAPFWVSFALHYPAYAGMAFQVLLRISTGCPGLAR